MKGLLKIVERFEGNEPLHRVTILDVGEWKRILKWLDVRKPKEAIFAWHIVMQLQAGERGATTTTRVWGDVTFCEEGVVLKHPAEQDLQGRRR